MSMIGSDIFYMDGDNKELCFKHAVQVAMNGHDIRTEIEVEEEQDPGYSGMMRIHDCYMCN